MPTIHEHVRQDAIDRLNSVGDVVVPLKAYIEGLDLVLLGAGDHPLPFTPTGEQIRGLIWPLQAAVRELARLSLVVPDDEPGGGNGPR
jgi:hypothetical protein